MFVFSSEAETENPVFCFSIYLVHDELKDKQFELELSWVGADTKGVFERVPQSVFQEAEKSAKAAMEDESDSDTEDMWSAEDSNRYKMMNRVWKQSNLGGYKVMLAKFIILQKIHVWLRKWQVQIIFFCLKPEASEVALNEVFAFTESEFCKRKLL